MNSHRWLPTLLAVLALTGCATFDETELGLIQRSGVSPRIVAKMEDDRVLLPEDVIELTRRKVPDRYLLRQIDEVGVDYVLSSEDFKKLQRARVSPAVLDALIVASDDFASRYAAPRQIVYGAAPYLDQYPYSDGFYGPPRRPLIGGAVGIGFSTAPYGRYRHP